jgi:hypothetical protein
MAAGGTVPRQGAAFLKAWQTRHGGGFGAAWGPVVLNEQIVRMAANQKASAVLAGSRLPAGQKRFWASAAADQAKRLAALKHELSVERSWRTQLGTSDVHLATWIKTAGGIPSLRGSVKSWKAQLARQKATIGAISKMLGYPAGWVATHPAQPKITHTYGGDVANAIAPVLARALAPFTGGVSMDRGGWLRPGWNPPMYNGLGRPEPVGAAAGGPVLVRLEVDGADQELVRLIRKMVKVKGGGNVQAAFGAR